MTTWDIQPSGGDYTSANAWASNASTVASDIGEVSGDWSSTTDTTTATLADNNLIFRGKVSDQARHAGFDNAGSNYELAVTSGHCLEVDNTGCTIDGLLITLNNTGDSNETIRMAASGGTVTLINSVFQGNDGGSGNQDGIYSQVEATINAENCYFTQFGRAGFHLQNAPGPNFTSTINAISCGLWECGLDGSGDAGAFLWNSGDSGQTGNFNVHNTWTMDCDSGSAEAFRDDGVGSDNWQLDNCMSSDASITARDSGAVNATESISISDGTPGAGSEIWVNDITGSAPYDLRLQDDTTHNDAQEQHSNASGAGLTIGDYTTGDIAGTTRSAPYDVGPFTVVSGGDTTLTADAGSYTWTGQVANLEYHSVVSAEAGSYAWTGQDATLTPAFALDAEAGSYAWTGQTANLEHHAVISAEAGSYAWTGQDATLLYSIIISAEAGSYAWTGQDASLLHTSNISAEAGSYAWTGQGTRS
jgi:hypothetical protein